jgi:diguanylate cyclase (GGDEF)-like protein
VHRRTRAASITFQGAEIILTRTLRALVPGLAVGALVLAALFWPGEVDLQGVSDTYALVLYAVGFALSAFFHRSRVLLALLALGLLDYGIGPAAERADGLIFLGTTLWGLLGILVLMRDRGVLSRGGAVQLVVAALVGGGGYFVFRDPERVAAVLVVQLPIGVPGALGLPQATWLVGAGAVLVTAWALYRWGGPVERAIAWTQLGLLLAMLPSIEPGPSGILLMACGLTLSLSVLEQSYRMAYRDELTGLPARRALMKDLADTGGTFTVAMVDVDHFKSFNDKHGHDVGDQVLKLVASRLDEGPGGGKAYRYGGEEFTLLYPGRARDAALPHVEAVRASVEAATFSLRAWNRPRKKPSQGKSPKKKSARKRRSRKLSVTVSSGVADSSGRDAAPEAVLKRADEALYRAKRDGRNRVAT